MADLFHLLNISYGIGRDAGADGSDCLAILGKELFSLASLLVQQCSFDLEKSYFSAYILYHICVLGTLTSWCLESPQVSEPWVG